MGAQCLRGKHGHVRCNVTANGCMCSRGCASSWMCKASSLCDPLTGPLANPDSSTVLQLDSPEAADAFLKKAFPPKPLPPRVTLALFLTFNSSLVRDKYRKIPYKAYNRELKRIKWFLASAARVQTKLPIHVIVGPERYPQREAELVALGATISVGVFVQPPAFAASSHHRLSFGKVGALALTQFDKVFVLDNDMALVHNIDDLAFAPTPSAVWHSSVAQFQYKARETCAVTTGLIGLTPSLSEYERATRVLASMPSRSTYDGGDQEFWRGFYSPWFELPVRYQAHQALLMPKHEWMQVRAIHGIYGLRSVSKLPKELRGFINYYT